MSINYRLSKAAEANLFGIWKYTCETWGEAQADRYLDELEAVCEQLNSRKTNAKKMPDVHEDLRFFHCGRHFIFWLAQATGEPAVVIGFLHDSMDITRHLLDRIDRVD